MIRTSLAACLLQLIALSALADDETLEIYTTDWLTPPLKVSGEPGDICAVELAIEEVAEHVSGTLTLLSGEPVFNQFGDADKERLKVRKLPVTFRETKPLHDPERHGPVRQKSGLLYEFVGQTAPAGLQLVLDTEQPADCRLLVIGAEKRIVRVLPLQSERLGLQAVSYARSTQLEMQLHSDMFIGNQDRFNIIRISGAAGKLKFEHNRNHFGLDPLGHAAMSTMMAFPAWTCSLVEMNVPDPKRQRRRLFKCELGPAENWTPGRGKPIVTDFDKAFLVLHPREGGWHRLILKSEGKIDRILPMHSERLHAWLRLKSQLTDATEQRVFELLSQEIPYYSEFMLKEGRVTFARIKVPKGNEPVLAPLADLPHLTDLEIQGDLVNGSHLERFTRLERLRFSHGSLSEDVLRCVGTLSQLKSLTIYTVRLDCRALKHLAGLRELTYFDYSLGDSGPFVENYEDSCVAVFSKLPELQELNLHALPLTPAAVAMLPTSKRLTRVQFGNQIPVVALLKYAQRAPATRISGRVDWRAADGEVWLPHWVTNDDLSELKNFENLSFLSLERADAVTDEGLVHLRSLKLKQLELVQLRNLTDAGLTHVARIEKLESLSLWNCEKLTTGAIPNLKRLPKLKKIKLAGTKIDQQTFRSAIPNCEIDP